MTSLCWCSRAIERQQTLLSTEVNLGAPGHWRRLLVHGEDVIKLAARIPSEYWGYDGRTEFGIRIPESRRNMTLSDLQKPTSVSEQRMGDGINKIYHRKTRRRNSQLNFLMNLPANVFLC
jgi:hypothetical protein